MNIERFTKLAELMDTIPDEDPNFDMRTWRCGTSACAVGWACADPWFNMQGLTLDWDADLDLRYPVFGGETGFRSIALFFDISEEDCDYLFLFQLDEGYTRPSHVAARIRDYIQNGRPRDTAQGEADDALLAELQR